MSFRYHGNWCGPGWTAGQWKDASELTENDLDVEAVDDLDQACKEHDISIAYALDEDDIEYANEKFMERAKELGIKGAFASWMVGTFGPKTPEKRNADTDDRYPKRLRRDKKRENEASPIQDVKRLRQEDTFITPERRKERRPNISPSKSFYILLCITHDERVFRR